MDKENIHMQDLINFADFYLGKIKKERFESSSLDSLQIDMITSIYDENKDISDVIIQMLQYISNFKNRIRTIDEIFYINLAESYYNHKNNEDNKVLYDLILFMLKHTASMILQNRIL